jgi:hypothetical protein
VKKGYTAIMSKKAKQAAKPSHPSIERVRTIAKFMDSAFTIPVINKKIGLDPLLGLLPVGGDMLSALVGAYIVWVAVELGMPRAVITRMGVNLIIDLLAGSVPVVGDIIDAMWKSNMLNVKILEEAYEKHGANLADIQPLQTVVDVVAEPVTG